MVMLLGSSLVKATMECSEWECNGRVNLATVVEKRQVILKGAINHPKAKQHIEKLKKHTVTDETVKYSFYDAHEPDDFSEWFNVAILKI